MKRINTNQRATAWPSSDKQCKSPPAGVPRSHRLRGGRADKCRPGTTLSEVLISLLVMSVGVVSLATLFPISVLRSLQATHLTNAANLRYNVESFLSIRPQLF